ncbi:MAG TPA: LarC family nickel insertion protein [Bryobacteraceae bacterium]|nr:LarC family nickel insertion protein [Bryobacteraceae bacterium]
MVQAHHTLQDWRSVGSEKRKPYERTIRIVRICYFDAFSGISGDMTVGALADAGADQAAIVHVLGGLGTGATFEFSKVRRRGIGATKFRVTVTESKRHRHLPGIVRKIEDCRAADRAKKRAIAAFEHLGNAEAYVHRVPIEQVHFHEVGAADSIADIVGACVALELLGIDEVVCSPMNVGSGTVETEHGILPIPAPATARLLEGRPIYTRGPNLELTTPTGAALASSLSSRFGSLPAMRVEANGIGAGDHDFPEHANVFRVIIGEPYAKGEETARDAR